MAIAIRLPSTLATLNLLPAASTRLRLCTGILLLPAWPVSKLALWEPPFIPEGVPKPPEDQVAQYERMIAEDRRGDAVEYFMSKVVGLPPEMVAGARSQPWWQKTEGLAHTLAYDARIMGDYNIPSDEAKSVEAPALAEPNDVVTRRLHVAVTRAAHQLWVLSYDLRSRLLPAR